MRAWVIAVALVFGGTAALSGVGAAAAAPTPAAPTAPTQAAPTAPTQAAPTAPTVGPPPPIAVAIDDGVTSVHSGEQLTYRVSVRNEAVAATTAGAASSSAQVLLELILPPYAKVTDAGGGTIRNSVIDFGLTVGAGVTVAESVVVSLATIPSDQPVTTALATVFVLGGSTTAAPVPDIRGVDNDTVSAAAPAAGGVSIRAGGAGFPASAGRSSGHSFWWVLLLILGVLLIVAGLVLTFQRTSYGRRRAGRSRVGSVPQLITLHSHELPTVRHASPSLLGSHQLVRPPPGLSSRPAPRQGSHQSH